MLSLFAPKLPIDAGELEWQLATFKWLGAEFGAEFGAAGEAPMVLPTAEFFPPSVRKGAGRVEDPVASVKAAAPWLKDYLRTDLKRAARALDRLHPDIAASVAAVDLADFAGD